MIWAGVFVVLALILCAAAVLAVVQITHLYLSGAQAIEHDGLAPGTAAPAWSLADSAGNIHRSPPGQPLQLIMFSDHSLKSFPSVADGLRAAMAQRARLEIVVLRRRAAAHSPGRRPKAGV